MRAAVPASKTGRHFFQSFTLFVVVDMSIAPENPDHARVFVTFAEPFAVIARVGRIKERLVAPVSAPRREHGDVDSAPVRFANDEIDAVPVVVIVSFDFDRFRLLGIGPKRQKPFRARARLAVKFRNDDRLNDVETKFLPIVQIDKRSFFVQAMKELPRRVAEPKERRAVFGYKKTAVLADF